ncbi:MAG: hypothetical protein ABJE47_15830 [bacterium]
MALANNAYILCVGAGAVLMALAGLWFGRPGPHPLSLTRAEFVALRAGPVRAVTLAIFKVVQLQRATLVTTVAFSLALTPLAHTSVLVRLGVMWCLATSLAIHHVLASWARTGRSPVRLLLRSVSRVAVAASVATLAMQVAQITIDHSLLEGPVLHTYSPALETVLGITQAPIRALIEAPDARPHSAGPDAVVLILLLVVAHVLVLAILVTGDAEAVWSENGVRPARRGWRNIDRLARMWGGWTGASTIVWKNVRTVFRTQPLHRFGLCAVAIPVLVGLTALSGLHGASSFVVGMACGWIVLLVAVGPLFVRNDLRLDLPDIAVLLHAPIRLADIARAGLLSAVIVLTLAQTVCSGLLMLSLALRSDLPFSGASLFAGSPHSRCYRP